MELERFFAFLGLIAVCFYIYHYKNVKNSIEETSPSSDASTVDSVSQSPSEGDMPKDSSSGENFNQASSPHPDESIDSPSDEKEQNDSEIGTPFVEVSPQNQITNANLYAWNEENDRDIIGNTYPAAMKLCVSNMIDAMFGNGQSDIAADVHIPFGAKVATIWKFSFVAAQDMVGNGSSANVTILADGIDLYPTFTLTSSTTEDLTYEIDLTGIRDLVFHFECTAVGSGFCAGIVLDDSIE